MNNNRNKIERDDRRPEVVAHLLTGQKQGTRKSSQGRGKTHLTVCPPLPPAGPPLPPAGTARVAHLWEDVKADLAANGVGQVEGRKLEP